MTGVSRHGETSERSIAARVAGVLADFPRHPRRTLARVRDSIENRLIWRERRRSLAKLPTPREPYSETDREIVAVHWVHRIPLPDGTYTPGDWNTEKYLARLGLPADFSGLTVLDVGTWDGLYAFEAERRGAARVLATDSFCWGGPGWGTRQGFDLAHRLLGSKVEAREIDVLDLSPEQVGVFDVVLFLGVLYHMKHPLLALEKVASVTGGMLIVETMVDLTFMRQPAMSYQRGRSQPISLYRHWRRDPTTWFVPNEAAVVTMLESVGFRRIERVYPRRFAAACRRILHLLNAVVPGFNVQNNFRAVFHAWK